MAQAGDSIDFSRSENSGIQIGLGSGHIENHWQREEENPKKGELTGLRIFRYYGYETNLYKPS